MFRAATEYALQHHIPVLYLAANSGARVGLATEVKQALKVAWKDAAEPQKGFHYLYLTDADYRSITGMAEPVLVSAKCTSSRVLKLCFLAAIVWVFQGLGRGVGVVGATVGVMERSTGLTCIYIMHPSFPHAGMSYICKTVSGHQHQIADQPQHSSRCTEHSQNCNAAT